MIFRLRILVLGANGFIGRHLSKHFAQKKELELVLFCRDIDPAFAECVGTNVEVVKGNIKDLTLMRNLIKGVDIVYHLISASTPRSTWEKPLSEIHENLLPSLELLELCAYEDVRKIVYLSSGGTVYGDSNRNLSEEDKVQPFSPYGITKLAVEHFLEYYRVKAGIQYDIYRISNAYGPGLNKPNFGVINTWLYAIKNNEPITVFGSMQSQKDYIFIEDLVKVISHSLTSIESSDLINVSSGEVLSLGEIIAEMKKIIPKQIVCNFRSTVSGDNPIVKLDNSKLRSAIPNLKFTPFKEGLIKTWKYISYT